MHVLIITKDVLFMNNMERDLKRINEEYSFSTVHSVSEAFRIIDSEQNLLSSSPIEIIVSDYSLIEGHIPALLTNKKMIANLIPVIILTQLDQQVFDVKLKAEGKYRVITPPANSGH